MLLTKIIAVAALLSWLGATGERLYDCLFVGADTPAQQRSASALDGAHASFFDLLRR